MRGVATSPATGRPDGTSSKLCVGPPHRSHQILSPLEYMPSGFDRSFAVIEAEPGRHVSDLKVFRVKGRQATEIPGRP